LDTLNLNGPLLNGFLIKNGILIPCGPGWNSPRPVDDLLHILK